MYVKRKGYRVERKIRQLFNNFEWTVIRAGASLGEIDLICLKNKKCVLLQIKSTNKKIFYYYGYNHPTYEGFPFFLIVDFGYNKTRILPPKSKITVTDGYALVKFLETY